MPTNSGTQLKKHLNEKGLSPEEFSNMSGMPLSEVTGILDNELPITKLRAHHLAAALDTDPDTWRKDSKQSVEK